MIRRIHLLFLSIFLSAVVVAQEGEPKMTKSEAYLQKVNEAWGYWISQKMMLERVAIKYPEKQAEAVKAWANFKASEIGQAFGGLESLLSQSKAKEWEDYHAMVVGRMRAKLGEKDLGEEAAEELVRKMAKLTAAEIPAEILMISLSAHPRYVEKPLEEIKDGFVRTIRSNGMEKAADVQLEMLCPASWQAVDGGTPRMLWRLKSKAGLGSLVSNLTILKLPGKLPSDEASEALKMPKLKQMAPKNSALISAKEMTLGGKPAGMLIYDLLNPAYPDEKIPFRILQISCVAQGALVQLQFAMAPEKDAELSLNEVTKRAMPLIQYLTESLKFTE